MLRNIYKRRRALFQMYFALGILGAALTTNTVRSTISVLLQTTTYLRSSGSTNLCDDLEALDLNATLSMIELALQDIDEKRDKEGIRMVRETCKEIQTCLEQVYRKIHVHNNSYLIRFIWNCDCSAEIKRLTMLRNRLQKRFELFTNTVRLRNSI